MNISDMYPVAAERSGWRDERISRRHRDWGFNLPFVDIDFLAVEYNHSVPVALVEYKNEHAAPINPGHPSFRALVWLADKGGLPAYCVRYTTDLTAYQVMPLNETGEKKLKSRYQMNEKEYVSFLYELRGRTLPPSIAMRFRA